jgi:hypothetical protein
MISISTETTCKISRLSVRILLIVGFTMGDAKYAMVAVSPYF